MRTLLNVSILAFCAAQTWAQATGAPPNLPPGLYAIIHTSMGTITAELFEKETPNTVRNFIALAPGPDRGSTLKPARPPRGRSTKILRSIG